MKSFFKITLLTASLAMLVGATALVSKTKQVSNKTEAETWTKEVLYKEVAINYVDGAKLGDDYVEDESGKFVMGVRHGNPFTNTITKFTTITGFKSSSNPKYTYDGENATIMNNWQIIPHGDDYAIVFFTAKESIGFSITPSSLGGEAAGNSHYYFVQRNGERAPSLINYIIYGTWSTLEQPKIILNEGDTFYYTYCKGPDKAEDKTVMNTNLPKFSFTSDLSMAESEVTLTSIQMTQNYGFSAQKCAETDYIVNSNGLFSYGLRYGTAWNKNFNHFEDITGSSADNSIVFNRSGSTTGTRVGPWGNIYTNANIGVILLIKANADLTFESAFVEFGGAPQSSNISYGIISTAGNYSTLTNDKLVSGEASKVSGLKKISLKQGEILTWEFRLTWTDGWDHVIQTTFPSFTLTNKSVDADNVLAQRFSYQYMHFHDAPSGESGTGKCISSGWYTQAKTAFAKLPLTARTFFMTDSSFTDAANRLVAWAAANGESLDTSNYVLGTNSVNLIKGMRENSAIVLVAVLASVSSLLVLAFFISKKKKHN